MILLISALLAVSAADSKFEALAARYVAELSALHPESATRLGDHKNDKHLDDRSAAGRKKDAASARNYLGELSKIDFSQLSPDDSVDARILRNRLQGRIYELEVIKGWTWDTLEYNVGGAIYGLIAREFAPAEERLSSVIGRLNEVPAAIAAAKANLQNPPKVFTETAIQQNQGTIALVQKQLESLVTPKFEAPFRAAQKNALAALNDYQEWLKTDLLPRSNGDFRLGADKFREKLKHTLDSDLAIADILKRAEQDLRATQDAMVTAAVQLNPALKDKEPHAAIQAALDQLAAHHPNNDTIISLATDDLKETTAFVRAKGFVTVPETPVQVTPTPEFSRGFAVASCNPPGALEKDGKTFYYISPTPTDWNAKRVESFFREYNDDMLQEMTIHEAMPGHYLQLAHANQFKAPTLIRAISFSGTFTEGWACYGEQVMAEFGYGGPAVHLQQLKIRLRYIINAIIDQKIHTANMSEEDALALMTREGFQEEGEAVGKWKRAQLSSTQLSTYYVGDIEWNDLRAAWEKKNGTSRLKEFHDAALSFGSPPSRYVRERLGL
jgi:uncharacterized protein (DUF885 family)